MTERIDALAAASETGRTWLCSACGQHDQAMSAELARLHAELRRVSRERDEAREEAERLQEADEAGDLTYATLQATEKERDRALDLLTDLAVAWEGDDLIAHAGCHEVARDLLDELRPGWAEHGRGDG